MKSKGGRASGYFVCLSSSKSLRIIRSSLLSLLCPFWSLCVSVSLYQRLENLMEIRRVVCAANPPPQDWSGGVHMNLCLSFISLP